MRRILKRILVKKNTRRRKKKSSIPLLSSVLRPSLLVRSFRKRSRHWYKKVANYDHRIISLLRNFFLPDIFFSDNNKNFPTPIPLRASSSPREEAISDVIYSRGEKDRAGRRERESAYPLMELRLFSVARQPIGGWADEKRATSGIYCPLSIPIWNS